MARFICPPVSFKLAFKLGLALGVSWLCLAVAAKASNPVVKAPLRGSSQLEIGRTSGSQVLRPAILQPNRTSGLQTGSIRGSVDDEVVLANRPDHLTVDGHNSSFLDDLGSTFLYLRDNFVPVILFRGTTDAVSDRDVTYTMPDGGPLRHSMMHSANVYDGLRGGTASVGDTVATALRGSYSARASLEKVNVDRARVHGALANFMPKLEGTVTSSLNGSTSLTSENRSGEAGSVGVELSMPLYTSGVNGNLYRQAQHTSKASSYSYLAEEHRVALEAITAHINLRLNRRIERHLGRNVSAMQKVATIARKLFEAGDSSRTDIAIADANVQSARSELDLARKNREEIQANFESLTGKHAPKHLGKLDRSDLAPSSLEEALAMANQFNPTLAASVETALASKHAARAERGKFGPQVNLFGSYNHEFLNADGEELEEDWRIGVRLRVPLFDATMSSTVNAAGHQALENGYKALDQRRLVERQVEVQWTNLNSAKRRVSIVRRQVNAIRQSVEGARREYQAGFRSVSDVLEEQVKLARAQITLERVLHEKMQATYELAFTTSNPGLRTLASAR